MAVEAPVLLKMALEECIQCHLQPLHMHKGEVLIETAYTIPSLIAAATYLSKLITSEPF